jgi:hypothetical protein
MLAAVVVELEALELLGQVVLGVVQTELAQQIQPQVELLILVVVVVVAVT